MLIQITDPSASGSLPLSSIAIGIDFGTTHCVAGYVHNDQVSLIPLGGHGVLLPSVVSYHHEQSFVGYEAADDPYAIYAIKRIMGRSLKEVASVLTHHPIPIAMHDDHLKLKTRQGEKYPVEVASTIFRYIKDKAGAFLNQPIKNAVVTVPAYFDDAARASIKDAATLAGLNVLRLVAEPTTAALAYGLDEGKEGIYIVYDFGGGTFDVSVLKMTQGVFQVLATGGDAFLGGDDIDALIVAFFLQDAPLSLEQRRNALFQARQVKEKLTTQLKATFESPLGDRCVLKREALDELIEPLVNRTLRITEDVLQQAGVSANDLQGIILVGGSTRIPKVQQSLSDKFNVPMYQTLNPDEVVAIGAAHQAKLLTRGGDNVLVDVTPLSLGVEMMGGIVDKIIPRNSPIPIRKAQNFTTFQDNQTGIVIHVVQGERELAKDCRSLGTVTLSGIPPMPAGMAKVKVVFALDADGLLTVSATEEHTGIAQTITVKPTYGLNAETMAEMILDSHRHAKEDMELRLLEQVRMEAKQIIQALEQALYSDSDLLSLEEIDTIRSKLTELSNLMLAENREKIRHHIDQLNQLTEDFAHKRVKKHL